MAGSKALVLASGSRGDCQPYMAFCIGLQEVGIETLLFTNPDHEKLCKDCNVPMEPNTIPFKQAFTSETTNKANQTGNFLTFLGELVKQTDEYLPATLDKQYALLGSYKPDFVVLGTNHFGDGEWIFACHGIPCIVLHLSNKSIPSRTEAPFGLPTLCGCWNLMLWKFVLGEWLKGVTKGQGKSISEKSGQPVEDLYLSIDQLMAWSKGDPLYQSVPYMIAQDEEIVGRGPGDPPCVVYTGSLVLPPATMVGDEFGGAKNAELQKFLASGPEPVYVGWGSVICGTPAAMCGLAVRSLKIAGCRGVILGGWAELNLDVLKSEPDGEELISYSKDNILLMQTAKHEDLFPKCAALVHHGGSGTTVAALRSGRPMVITPILYDQFDFAKLVATKGNGIDAGHLTKVKAEDLAKHIQKCLQDDSMKQSAKTIGDIMKKSNGAKKAAEISLKFLNEQVKTGTFAKNKADAKAYSKSLKAQSKSWNPFAVCCAPKTETETTYTPLNQS
eukprot:gnl/MRDRNA2_/MRDRNA2_97032_c0_seq1.p1 gnl/MRDRNA2_/MRDRNA2_97032_c0~~gnl/MRDRNA2_/MRDRNA2_97032_c0_seq1.p1  ORF type:complete len:502 (-),score=111.89 gnl/MRDRNA2_/MRDRNA2_97032_c0_seq1:194-1699(-)